MRAKALAAGFAAALAIGSGPILAATTWYVATTGTDETGCGTTAAPCKTIQYTIDLSADGDTVVVGNGSYNECVVVVPGTGVGGVSVLAAGLVDANAIGLSILDGAAVCDTASGTPGPVAVVNDLSVLSGFAIKNGGDSGVWGRGAAIITNNIISSSTTTTVGGGIRLETGLYLTDPTKPAQIKFNTIQNNTSDSDGAGLYVDASANGVASVVVIDGNTISTNTAGATTGAYGAGMAVFTGTAAATDSSSVVITTNVVADNTAGATAAGAVVSYGGGIFAATGAAGGLGTETITIGGPGVGNLVRGNVAHGIGGGISANLQPADGATHTMLVIGNDVTANTGDLGGGGVHAFAVASDLATGTNSITLTRNSIVGNHALADPTTDPFNVGGGGVFAENYSYRTPHGVVAFDVSRNGIRSNDSANFGGGASVKVVANDDPNLDGNTLSAAASVTFENNLVATNKATDATNGPGVGGGVAVNADSIGAQASVNVPQRFLTVIGNQTVVDAQTAVGGGGVEWAAASDPDSLNGVGTVAFELSNSILQGNDGFGLGGTIAPGGTISVAIDYNDSFENVDGDYEAQLGAATGTNGNISVDPGLDVFYSAPLCSATIDQGDPALTPSNEPLPNGGRVNLGHLGNTLDAARTLPDVNGDGNVDGLDVLGIAVSFNTALGDPRYFAAADRDLNNLVDGADLAYVAAFYAQSCP